MDTQPPIETLKAKIAQQEAELADLESEILDIEQEMKAFADRYHRLIQPLQDKLDLLQDMIAELEKKTHSLPESPPPGSRWTTWTPPADYIPVEEQYRQTWQLPKQRAARFDTAFQPPPPTAAREDDAKQELKTLYRQLARRFHPDLSTDPTERERRNRLMAEINAAYAGRDLDALRALAAQPDDARIDEPIAILQLRQLQQIHAQLDRRLGELRFRRSELFHGEMMALKIQASLAARHGHDLLQEMADQLERDYRASLDRLDQLRGSV